MRKTQGLVLTVLDCVRADHLSCYGYARQTTPMIDALAEKGVLWEQAYSTSSWTKPSVGSLLTGRYPTEHGAFRGIIRHRQQPTATTDVLRSPYATLPEILTDAGWRCAAFIHNDQLGTFTRFNRGFTSYTSGAGKADRLLSLFREWLSKDVETPFFAYLHFLETHWPYKPRTRHLAIAGGNPDANCFCDYSARDFGRLKRAVVRGETSVDAHQVEQMIQLYDGAIRRLDGKVKRLRRILREMGLSRQTILVITSDHGEEFLEHGNIGHGQSLYEELTHVPLIARIPGGPAGVRYAEPVSHVDLAATLLSAGGVPGEMPGHNLLAADGQRRPACSELVDRRRYWQCIRAGRWKLHRRFKFKRLEDVADGVAAPRTWSTTFRCKRQLELYDLLADPGELADRSDDPQYAAQRDDLTSRLDSWWESLEEAGARDRADAVELDDGVVGRLRDLGYIE